ncbi:hypothetical protein [Nonomuraea africana]
MRATPTAGQATRKAAPAQPTRLRPSAIAANTAISAGSAHSA